jgi:predicted nuclease of predicted toxin-antitoxin system
MNLYLDEDSAQTLLVKLLRAAGHDVLTPATAGHSGEKDPAQFSYAIREDRVFLTHNYDDFQLLHELILLSGGHHPGVLVARRDNNPAHNLKPHHIVRAIRKLSASASPVRDELITLNHWR